MDGTGKRRHGLTFCKSNLIWRKKERTSMHQFQGHVLHKICSVLVHVPVMELMTGVHVDLHIVVKHFLIKTSGCRGRHRQKPQSLIWPMTSTTSDKLQRSEGCEMVHTACLWLTTAQILLSKEARGFCNLLYCVLISIAIMWLNLCIHVQSADRWRIRDSLS